MIELKNNDLIITSRKKYFLKKLNEEKKLINLKFMTLNELKQNLFGKYDSSAIYYLVDKYNYRYQVAKMYLDNFMFINDLKDELIKQNLIEKQNIKCSRIIVDNLEIDPYILRELKGKEIIYLDNINNNYKHEVYEFENINDEVNFVCIKLLELLKTININKIKLVADNEYNTVLKRMFKFYNIPINLNISKSIYSTNIVKNFINDLNESKDIEYSVSKLDKNEITKKIIEICNKYIGFKNINTSIYCIIEELKMSHLNECIFTNSINVINIDEITSDDNYYFILGFNQGNFPKIYKDEDYLSDLEKQKIGIFTSQDKNKFEKQRITNIIKNIKNLTISYKLNTPFNKYYKSELTNILNLKVVRLNVNDYTNSNLFNKLTLSSKLDNLIKYNVFDDDINILYSNYSDINYLKYDNKYKKIDENLLYKYLDNKLLLSYSSLDNYYKCSFKYYISNILKLNKFESTFATFIGELFHYVLSCAFLPNFDFELEFNKYLEGHDFKYSELFFIEKLKTDLKFVIAVIKEQNTYSNLDNSLYEQKVYVDKSKNVKVTFMGVIDKLNYKNVDGKTVVAIIDYKTGNAKIDLNNSIYGLNLQLPIYLYLASNLKLSNVSFAGFYLQKIINGNINYQMKKDSKVELKKLYKLDGYSNIDTSVLELLDKNYSDSDVIKGMKVSKSGFYKYTKVLSDEQINTLISLVDKKIDDARDDILNSKFDINPKRINNELLGCKYCKFNDICYMKEEDIIDLEEVDYTSFLGGE